MHHHPSPVPTLRTPQSSGSLRSTGPLLVPRRASLASAVALVALLSACGGGGGITNEDKVDLDDDTPTNTGVPKMLISDTDLDFGRVKIGGSSAESVTINNTGTGTLTVQAFTLSVAGEFEVLASAGLAIPAQGSAGVTVKYIPIDYADDDVTLIISTDDPSSPDVTVRLEGSPVTDADEDGFDSLDAGGDDCDDDNPDINPVAEDMWYDGIDSNCDNADDYDQDGDGYQVITYNDEPSASGGDCQDANPDMYPGADDEWYDGIDSDCDGSNDFDQDGDGYDALIGGGDDCDDSDPQVNPDNAEKLNGADDDCNGFADDDVPGWNADRVYAGTLASNYAGFAITMGDLDDDGDEDLVVGAYGAGSGQGAIGVFDGGSPKPDGTDIQGAHEYIPGSGASDQFGYSVAVLEQSGAFPEPYLAVGAPNGAFGYGMVYLLLGDDARAGGTTSSAVYTISGSGSSGGHFVGRGLSQDVDLDGDGSVDLLGYYRTTTSVTGAPHVFLFYGDNWDSAATQAVTVSDADARFSTSGGGSGSTYNSRLQWNFTTGGDGNGDGYQDFMACDYMADVNTTNDGAIWMLWGDSDRYSNSTATSLTSYGDTIATSSQYDKGMSLCDFIGDLDGDGDDEFAGYVINSNVVYIFEGGSNLGDSVLREDDAWASFTFGSGTPEASSLRAMGDWTGDGVPELGVGISSGGTDGGSLYILPTEQPGEWDAEDDAFSVIEGDTDYDNVAYGSHLNARAGDWDGDGNTDLIVGDYLYGDTTRSQKGAVFVTFGGN